MKVTVLFAFSVVTAMLLCATVKADDPTGVLAAAAEAAQVAPAFRVTSTSTYMADGRTAAGKSLVMTMEMVNPDQIHMKLETDGKPQTEMVTDGNKVFMSQGGGKLTEAPVQVCAALKLTRAELSGETVAKMARNVKLVGHETMDGVSASIYTYDSDMAGLHATTKQWISDQDHRPLKAESEAKGQGRHNQPVDVKTTAVFEYDPSIKIAVPSR